MEIRISFVCARFQQLLFLAFTEQKQAADTDENIDMRWSIDDVMSDDL